MWKPDQALRRAPDAGTRRDSRNMAIRRRMVRGKVTFAVLGIAVLVLMMGGSVFLALRFVLPGLPAIALRWPIKKWAAAAAGEFQFKHEEFGGIGGGEAAQAPEAGAETEAPKPFVRSDRKVGRNEPCPCGSGKKFKHCHGQHA